MARGRSKRRVDWKKIERQFRAGLLSVSEISRENDAPESTIRYYAKARGWKRDLTDEVRRTTRTKMVENLAAGFKTESEILKNLANATDNEIIEEAAKTQVQVVREHQKTLGNGHSLTLRMLDELDATTAYRGELQALISATVAPNRQEALRRAVSLSSRATIMRDLATAARLWVTLERQAFSIVDDQKDINRDRKLDEMTAEQLRSEIMEDAKKLGLPLEQVSQGVVAKPNGNGRVH